MNLTATVQLHPKYARICAAIAALLFPVALTRADNAIVKALQGTIREQEWMDAESKDAAGKGVERALASAPDLGPDKNAHAPAQFQAWLRNSWMPNASSITTPERRGIMGEVTEIACATMRELPPTDDAARERAKAQTKIVTDSVQPFVEQFLTDTPPEIKAQIVELAQKDLAAESDTWGDYFRPNRHSWSDEVRANQDELFVFVRNPHYFLDKAPTMYAQTRQLLSQPGMSEQSKAFFTKDYSERAARSVASGFRMYMDDAVRRTLASQVESLRGLMSKDLRDRYQAMMQTITNEAKAAAEQETKNAATPVGEKVRRSLGTTTTGGVPQGPK
jgi:hypothetical protein